MEKDITKYKSIFLSEAKEHLAVMNRSLLKLEKNPQEAELLDDIFRALHTLKSMAATMNYSRTEGLCHGMEDVLDLIKKKKIELNKTVNILFECFDAIELTLKEISQNKEEPGTSSLIQKLKNIIADKAEIKPLELAAKPQVVEKIKSIEVKVKRLDLLMNLAEELLINRMRLDGIKEGLEDPELSAAVDTLGRLVTDMQYNIMQARMVPVGFTFNRFPRMVRDLAKQQKKEVNLTIEGSEIELDRAVIDQIGEPLVHLLRNAVDHGIEMPEERKKHGKPKQGTIKLIASRVRGFALIEVEDDGKGIDWENIKNTAIKQGILSPEAITEEELKDSLFSGLSTTKDITEISGRGLGLNIIKKKVKSLGGAVKVESLPARGTKFKIELPLTLAIVRALLVSVGGQIYAIPLADIEKIVSIEEKDVKGMLEYEALVLDGENIPLTRLNILFNTPPSLLEGQSVVIVRRGDERIGLVVDSIAGTQEIVIKPLNKLVRENKYFAGSTIVGSGEVILILDISNLVMSKRQKAELI